MKIKKMHTAFLFTGLLGITAITMAVTNGGQASFSSSLILNDFRNEKITSWSVDKTSSPALATNPQATPVSFDVKVTEGPTDHLLSETYTLIVTNSGSAPAYLANVVVNLQKKQQKEKYATFASIIADRANPARTTVPTCFGNFSNSPAARSIQIVDSQNNDIIALNDVPIIQPGQSATLLITTKFDADQLGVDTGSSIRKEVLITFENAGVRGNSGDTVSCQIDADGDGTTDNSRTVASRISTQIPQVVLINQSVQLTDNISHPADNAIIDVVDFAIDGSTLAADGSNVFNTTINATGIAGTQTVFKATSNASCQADNPDGGTTVIGNTATIATENPSYITGSPAQAMIDLTCNPVQPPEIEIGDFVTYSQGGWGTRCSGSNPGCLRDNYFNAIFPFSLHIGDFNLDGPIDGYGSGWMSSESVDNFLPARGTAGVLTADLMNPTSTSAGVFAGQLTALILNAEFDKAGYMPKNNTGVKLENLIYMNPNDSGNPLNGYSVGQIIAIANTVISGLSSPFTPDLLNTVLTQINENFNGGTVNHGYLILP